jgi:hypothetical protein|tara:strand:+ start:657 stop:1184 length:528 start_codon:yes stop_codon:yes gene_type:complete
MKLLTNTKDNKNEMLTELMYHVNCIFEISNNLDLGDPFSYNRMREILMAIKLGHTVATTYAGADAFDENGDPTEYKSTTQKKICGTYNGISNYDDWGEQWNYIVKEKIGCYKWHHIGRFEGPDVKEVWRLSADDVLSYLKPKLRNSWENRHKRKDPRLGASLAVGQIKQKGIKVI